MKYGVLTFSYKNAKNFKAQFEESGFFSMNIGDYTQTLAIRQIYKKLGIPADQTIEIDRDSLATYSGEPVIVLMNAVFFPWCFPISKQVIPIFVGFQTSEAIIKDQLSFFKQYEPIGCRDVDTANLFKKHGIEAFASGCATMTFDERASEPEEGKVFLVYGSGAGTFPSDALNVMPDELVRRLEFVSQRKAVHRFPLDSADMRDAERYAASLLKRYREEASLVLTPLHHVATPCMSSGIPVILCRKDRNTRFSFLEQFVDVYTPERFGETDWYRTRPDIRAIQTSYIEAVAEALALRRNSTGSDQKGRASWWRRVRA